MRALDRIFRRRAISQAIKKLVSWTPASLFTPGVNGAWYDPSDYTTLFRDAAGTLPVTAVEQPVGLMLDKRDTTYSTYFDGLTGSLGVASGMPSGQGSPFTLECWIYSTKTGPNIYSVITRGDSNGCLEFGVWNTSLSLSIVGGATVCTSAANVILSNTWYHVALTRTSGNLYTIYVNGVNVASGTDNTSIVANTKIGYSSYYWNHQFLGYISNFRVTNTVVYPTNPFPTAPLTPVAGTSLLTCGTTWSGNPAITTVGNARADKLNPFKTGTGNHAFNSSGNSANFPVLSARYNLLTKSEQFDDAAWTKQGSTVSGTNFLAPNESLTGSLILEKAATDVHGIWQNVTISSSGLSITYNVYLKYHSRQYVRVAYVTGGGTQSVYADVDLINGYVVNHGPYSTATQADWGIVPDKNGWWKVTVTGTLPSTLVYATVYARDTSANSNPESAIRYFGDTTKGFYIWGADLRVANDALNQPAYQRVNTATDYDTVGFKPAEVFDGVDDNLIASAGGGSTTAFFWCSAIRVGKVGAVQTLFSDAGTNTGYSVRINASNQLELSAGNGTAYTTVATTATLSIGQRAVLTAWHDGTNLNIQINNDTVHQAAFATATAGTAQFTIGKDNNAASNFFAGRLYEKVYTKDNVPSSAQITSTKTYVANVAGITLS